MSKEFLEKQILEDFCDYYVKNRNNSRLSWWFGRFGYNQKNRTQHEIVNSVIYWFREIAIPNINEIEQKRKYQTKDLIVLVDAIHVLVEGTNQLYRLFIDPNNPKNSFSSERKIYDIFQHKNKEDQQLDDDKYFQELRSMIGQHPMNMRLSGSILREDGSKWIVSDVPQKIWAMHHTFGMNGDFCLSIWTGKIEEDYNVDVYISELLGYAEKRYQYLIELQKQTKNIANKKITKPDKKAKGV